jgi:peptide/nickel transport system permease protein
MLRYALRRLLQLVPTLLGVTLLTFILFNVVGGSPAAIVLGKNATAEALADYDRMHGYDKPLPIQYVAFLGDLLRGYLGTSIEYHQPAWHVIRDGVLVSLSLTVPILVIGTVLALLVGLLCAATANRLFDKTALAFTTALMSVNYVIWVTAGQYLFAYKLKLFPVWGYENWTYLCLPVLIGVVSSLGSDVRFYRTVILDEVNRPHVRTAISKGLHPATVLLRHVLRNSLIPVVTNVSLSVPFLFAGSILLESFYGIPGLGGLGLNAVNSSDFAMVRAVVIVGAVLYQVSNLLADLAYAWLDPRVRIASD